LGFIYSFHPNKIKNLLSRVHTHLSVLPRLYYNSNGEIHPSLYK